MKRNKLITIIFTAGFLLIGSSCNKFVNLTPQDNIPVTGFYKTEADIKLALTGTYGNLRGIYNYYYELAELPSDNTRTSGGSENNFGMYDKFIWLTNDVLITQSWTDAYRTISNANVILDRIDAISFASDATRQQYKGEAKFIRALMYFNLVRFFDGVPIVLTQITDEAGAYTYGRSTADAVYAQIEKDLSEAETVLPASYTGADVGRVTVGAARALLGKVYLQEKKWSQAETKLAQVINSGTYSLLPNVANAFGLGHDNNSEIVFAVQYMASGFGEGNTFSYNMAPQKSGTSIVGVQGGDLGFGTSDLYNSFEAGDTRQNAFIGIYIAGSEVQYWAKKFVYYVTLANEGDNDWPVLRYADVLLMYAEALNNDGNTTQAINYINIIRQRAGLAAKPLTLSAADTQLAIEKERRVELCFEGQRWYDLIRWGKDYSTMVAFKAAYTATDPTNSNMTPGVNKKIFPIPYREIALNPNLTQNPGY